MTPPVRQAAIPLGSVALATALTWLLWPYVQPSSTPLFFVAVMASAVYGGVVAGLIATVVSTTVIAVLFMPPLFSFDIGSDDAFRLLVFGGVALLTNSMAAERRRAEAQQQRLIDELREANARITTLSDIPLIVLSHGKTQRLPGQSAEANREFEQTWQQMHVELTTQSSNAKRIVAEKSGHYIHLDQSELVIDAIREVVEAARRR